MILIVLFIILPQYIYIIFGVNIVNLVAIIFLLSYILLIGKVKKLQHTISGFWLYALMYAIQCLITVGGMKFCSNILTFFLIPYFCIILIDSKEKFQQMIDYIIGGAVFLGILGVIEAIVGINFIQHFANTDIVFFYEIRYGVLRIMTTFGQPIAYGIFQVFVIALINYKLGLDTSNKRFLRMAYAISFLNIFLTGSRMPIIMYLIVQILLNMKKSSKSFSATAIFFVLIFPAILLAFELLGVEIPIIDGIIESIMLLISGQNDTSSSTQVLGDRSNLWLWVFSTMEEKWLFGHGVEAEFVYKIYDWQIKRSIENQYLNILYQMGIIGVAFLVLSYISIIIYAYKGNKRYGRNGEKLTFNYVVLVVMITYYVVCLGVQETDLSRLYVIVVACLISYNRICKSRV